MPGQELFVYFFINQFQLTPFYDEEIEFRISGRLDRNQDSKLFRKSLTYNLYENQREHIQANLLTSKQ